MLGGYICHFLIIQRNRTNIFFVCTCTYKNKGKIFGDVFKTLIGIGIDDNHAVHAAMSGRTAMVVSLMNGHFVHVPTELAIETRKKVDTKGLLWQSVLDNTGQPKNLN